MTLDLGVICILGVPVAGIAVIGAASVRQFILGDGELVRLAGADHQLALAAVGDLAGDGAIEEAVPQAIEHDLFEVPKRLGRLAAMRTGRQGDSGGVTYCATIPSCP